MGKAYYTGKRMVAKTPRHSMCDSEGSWHYPKAKDMTFYGARIGHEYETPEEKQDGATAFVLPRYNWSECETGNVHPDRDAWQAEHRLAIELRKQSNQDLAPELQAHVDALRDAVARMNSGERITFLAYLITTFTSWRR